MVFVKGTQRLASGRGSGISGSRGSAFGRGGAGGGTRGARSSDTGASVLRVYIHSENLGNANAAGSQLSIAGEWNIDSKLSGFEQQ